MSKEQKEKVEGWLWLWPYALCFLLGRLGMPLLLFVPLLAAFALYHKGNDRYRDPKHVHDALNLLENDPQLRIKQLLHELPPWIQHSDIEQTRFANALLKRILPFLSDTIQLAVVQWVNPIMDSMKPAQLTKLGFSKLSLGEFPPRIEGVKVVPVEEQSDQFILDVFITFVGSPDIQVAAATSLSPDIVTKLTHVDFSAKLRIILGPFISRMPTISAVTVMFLEKPKIDFKLSALNINVMAVKNLSEQIVNIIKDQMANYVVYPQKFVIPLAGDLGDDALADLTSRIPDGFTPKDDLVEGKLISLSTHWKSFLSFRGNGRIEHVPQCLGFEKFKAIKVGKKYAFEGHDREYLSVDAFGKVVASKNIGALEVFLVLTNADRTRLALESSNGRFVSARESGKVDTVPHLMAYELFEVIDYSVFETKADDAPMSFLSNGRMISVKTHHKTYLSYQRPRLEHVPNQSAWEVIKLVQKPGNAANTFHLQLYTKEFLTLSKRGCSTRDTMSEETSFVFIPVPGGNPNCYGLLSSSHLYLSAREGKAMGGVPVLDEWEVFEVIPI